MLFGVIAQTVRAMNLRILSLGIRPTFAELRQSRKYQFNHSNTLCVHQSRAIQLWFSQENWPRYCGALGLWKESLRMFLGGLCPNPSTRAVITSEVMKKLCFQRRLPVSILRPRAAGLIVHASLAWSKCTRVASLINTLGWFGQNHFSFKLQTYVFMGSLPSKLKRNQNLMNYGMKFTK